jgi:hypothetical protein
MRVRTSDYFAEIYVAGRFAEAGWNVYFPRRDRGFDFIASKALADGQQMLRPVQVKGKYPTAEKQDRAAYGYLGGLTELHPEMVLVIPFFDQGPREMPTCVAYLPRGIIKPHKRGFRCSPATLASGLATPRRDYRHFFNDAGLKLVEKPDWVQTTVVRVP